ncbi:protein NipSnap homolog 3A-like isoform X1 [Conger conger]|uniref:protein NipSnap homolog 3A-like isoform X1 n=1 Tax=Conger conger TaxID=82655 RepID=UPI002A5AF6C7|nr:protein NipSnap homolog 3A-like isoform X1 [Conger conger]
MTALRITLRKACSFTENILPKFRKNLTETRASISTGPQQQHATFYEFRTYRVEPAQNAAFLRLTNEKIHLRTAHSELLGYWSVEYGGLNQVFHIWKYDSYAQRAAVRAALAQDPEWIEQYISKAMPMLASQDNEVTYRVPWSQLDRPPKEGGVYELATFQMRPGGPAVWGEAFQAAVTTHARPGYAHLVGVFHSEVGRLNRVHVLWWYENPDQRAGSRHKAHGDARVVAAVRGSVTYLEKQSNKLLFPTPFSPLK